MPVDKRKAAAAHSYFDCEYCVLRTHAKKLPTHGPDGVVLEEHERQETYNDRRYRHYLDDFSSRERLKEHLTDRVLYWTHGKPEVDVQVQLQGIEATLGWWERAQNRKAYQRALPGVSA